jgi:hypothetical protein
MHSNASGAAIFSSNRHVRKATISIGRAVVATMVAGNRRFSGKLPQTDHDP